MTDRETAELRREQNEVQLMVEGPAWAHARRMLLSKIANVLDIRNTVTMKDGTAVPTEARALAVELVDEWIREVEGISELYKNNDVSDNVDDEYISRY